MNNKQYMFLYVILLLLYPTHSYSNEDIKIGVLLRDLKPNIHTPSHNNGSAKAVDLAIEDFFKGNKNRDLKEDSISFTKYLYKDHLLGPLEQAKKMVEEDGVKIGVGLQTSSSAHSAAKVIVDNGAFVLSPYATDDKLHQYSPHIMLMSSSTITESKALSKFLLDEYSNKKIAFVVSWDRPFSKSIYLNLSDELKKSSLLVKTLDVFKNKEEIVSKLLEYKPEVVVLPNFPVNSASLINVLVKRLTKLPVFVGPSSWGEGADHRFAKITKGTNFTGYIVRQHSRFANNETQKSFDKRLENMGIVTTSIAPKLYYDSTMLLLEEIDRMVGEKVGITPLGISSRLDSKGVYQGLLGPYCMKGAVCAKSAKNAFHVIKVKDSGFSYVKQYSF